MKTSGSNFELIMQELLKQKQLLEDLEAENRELQRQLADLRAGRGIYVDILGQRFALNGETPVASEEADRTPATTPTGDLIGDPAMQETSVITNVGEAGMPSIPETPVPDMDVAFEEVAEDTSPSVSSVSDESPIFLEEMLLDEFVSATTSQIAVWNGPETKRAEIDEEQKAALRRELMGSFLLE